MSSESALRVSRGSAPKVRAVALGALLSIAGCAHGEIRRFPHQPPMWVDEGDFRPFSPMPEEYYSPFAWDGADQMLFRPMSRFFQVDVSTEARNVNAMDEVPDSSWFENRLSRRRLSTARIVQAACEGPPLDPHGTWHISSAKPNGANPGFIIEDDEGRRYLLKFDSTRQPERATMADVVGSIVYWAAGYHTPCNRIVFFERNILELEEDATAEVHGHEVPLTWEMLEPVFERANRLPDGRMRALSSLFLQGRPVGPFRYEGIREDDPNDVVPHEARRELRGAYVLASLINHFDSREQNSLAMFIDPNGDGRGYVRHNYIDWGDSFGSMWSTPGISPRLGHSSYFDMKHFLEDFLSLGAIERPWHDNHLGLTGETLGYFNVETFVPDRYRPGYPNPAFNRATERDKAWMARIIANLEPEAIEAAVAEAQLHDRVTHRELVRILLGRREAILRRWLRKLSPLTWPTLERGGDRVRVCVRDLAIATGIVERWEDRPYWARAYHHLGGDRLVEVPPGPMARRRPDRICVGLPRVAGASIDDPAYLIVDLTGLYGSDDRESRPLRMHFYQTGPARYHLAGVERPYDLHPPDAYDR